MTRDIGGCGDNIQSCVKIKDFLFYGSVGFSSCDLTSQYFNILYLTLTMIVTENAC